ncbi:MAG: hypothetical protein GY822_31010 [Deltaproteobacteria bacterium]|nr:hypothetical protein [Deltaproteobacteria bacterium]
MFEIVNVLLSAFCVGSGLLVVLLHHPARAAGALALCTLSTGALLVLHGFPSLGGSVAFVMVMSALFLLFVQLTLNVGETPDRRRLSFRGTLSAMSATFFGVALVGSWLPMLNLDFTTSSPEIHRQMPSMSWQKVLFAQFHIEVALLGAMALITVLVTFLLIRRRP